MDINELPKMNMDTSETGCCPKFNPEPWDDKEIEFKDKLFVKANTINFMHVPLNMGSMYKRISAKLKEQDAVMKDSYLVLSYDPSLWKGEHYFAVEKDIPDEEMVRLSGKYLTKIFEGPYKYAGIWVKKMDEFVKSKDKNIKKLYFFYTTCPKCLKYYGKNYVVAFAEV